MLETFILTLNQILKLFIFMAIGYAFNKTKLYPREFSTILSRLEVHVFMPALVFTTFSTNFNAEVIAENSLYMLTGLVMLALAVVVALPLARLFGGKVQATRDVFLYAFTIPNLGYMGYPLVEAVFGEVALFHFMMFALPFNVFIYTVGITILNPKRELSIKKLLNPSIIAIIIGMIFGLLRLPLPSFMSSACDLASGCMAPCAMLLSGYVLAKSPVKQMVGDVKMYLASLIRLLVLPALAFAGLKLVGVQSEIVLIAVSLFAMPLGLNTVVFPEAFGGDSSTGAKSCFVSNLLGIITIPIVFAVIAAFA